MISTDFIPSIYSVVSGYRNGLFTPRELFSFLSQRADQFEDRNIWIQRIDEGLLETYIERLESTDREELPLYGVPFAAKDNIDVVGFATTAGCPEFGYTPTENAHIIENLIAAGAVPMGKTNLDQFATGLVGTRSPHGPVKNSINPDYISGGSSSGSAVAVALGLVSFSLGTDTAGSGRVPAMLNNIIGMKPSRGLFSMSGVVPACRSLDCPSVFALDTNDAATVFDIATDVDENDDYSRPNGLDNSIRTFGHRATNMVIGVPKLSQLEFFGAQESSVLFSESVEYWRKIGATVTEIDLAPLLDAARLLYEGPWVAERYAAIRSVIEEQPDIIHPVVRGIIEGARDKTAVDAFTAEYQMQSYRIKAQQLFSKIDILLTPTAPRHYLIDEVLADPVKLNSNMGYYTNFMNLLDLCGISVPSGFSQDGLPFGVTLVAPAFRDVYLLNAARVLQDKLALVSGAMASRCAVPDLQIPTVLAPENIDIAVCGAHLADLPLNWQLIERRATLKLRTTTSENYRMFLLSNFLPQRPGLLRTDKKGVKIELEVWSVPADELGGFINNIPYPLGIGKVELESGDWVSGFMCESHALNDATDISHYGSWRRFQQSLD